jgi:hypothetical protein
MWVCIYSNDNGKVNITGVSIMHRGSFIGVFYIEKRLAKISFSIIWNILRFSSSYMKQRKICIRQFGVNQERKTEIFFEQSMLLVKMLIIALTHIRSCDILHWREIRLYIQGFRLKAVVCHLLFCSCCSAFSYVAMGMRRVEIRIRVWSSLWNLWFPLSKFVLFSTEVACLLFKYAKLP